MAGCMLRASGKGFSAAAFIAKHPMKVLRSKGGLLVALVSEKDGADLPGQIADAIFFLSSNAEALRSLINEFGCTASLDFGVWRKDALSQSVSFPASLVATAGRLGIGVDVSLYETES
jgi:hypothetical protein